MYACTGKGKEYERNIETDRLPRKHLSYASRASLCTFYPVDVESQSGSKVGAILVFLSVRYNESLPASLHQHINSLS